MTIIPNSATDRFIAVQDANSRPDPFPHRFRSGNFQRCFTQVPPTITNTSQGQSRPADSLAQHALSLSRVGVCVVERTGRIPVASSEMRQLFGFAEQEPLHVDQLVGAVQEEDREEWRDALNAAVELGEAIDVRIRIAGKDAGVRFVDCVAESQSPATGEVAVVFRDATEETLDRLEVVNQRRELEISQSIAQVGSWKWYPETDRSVWSREMSRMFGLAPGQAPDGMADFLSMIHPEDVANFQAAAETLMTKRVDVSARFRLKRMGNEKHFLLQAQAPVIDQHGNTLVRGVTQDVTSSFQSASKIQEQSSLIADANAELVALNNYLRDFTHLASHDLRSPLTNMEVLLGMLAERAEMESAGLVVMDKLKQSVQSIKQTLATFSTILEMKNARGLVFEQVDLAPLVHSTWQTLASGLPDEDRTLVVNTDQWDQVWYPRHQLLSIIQNFISNAIKYRRPEVPLRMEVRTEWEEGAPVLVFQDNGRGMDLTTMEHRLFRMYQRFHPDVEGQGVGLHLIHSLVRAHGGNIRVESAVEEGTAFRVRLTAHETNEPARPSA